MKEKVMDFILLNVGIIMVSSGMYFFLMPNNLAAGGANGAAIIINSFIPGVSIGIIMLIINIVLFLVAFVFIGNNFGAKTIYASLGISFLVMLFEKIFKISNPITGDLFIELMSGVLISGIGMGIVFNQDASTGGTDITAKILNKFFNVDMGKGVLMCDLFITLSSAFAFDIRLAMYSTIGVIINGFVIDAVLEGINTSKQVFIISSEYKKINEFIVNELSRGSTIYYGKGGFTYDEKSIINAVVGRRDFAHLKRYINEVDDNAFLIVNNVSEVFGDGFKNIKL